MNKYILDLIKATDEHNLLKDSKQSIKDYTTEKNKAYKRVCDVLKAKKIIK